MEQVSRKNLKKFLRWVMGLGVCEVPYWARYATIDPDGGVYVHDSKPVARTKVPYGPGWDGDDRRDESTCLYVGTAPVPKNWKKEIYLIN